jgi:hypothetical protein
MSYKSDLSAIRLRELLNYDPATGIFTWKVNTYRKLKGKKAGSTASNGYWDIRIDRSLYKAHRLAWLYVHGRWPADQIDHINGERADNRIENLRECSRAENMQNSPVRKDSQIGLKGVSTTPGGRYVASISANKAMYFLGTFDTPEEAHSAYVAAKEELHLFSPHLRSMTNTRIAA